MTLTFKKFRIELHSDTEGYPNCWYIQERLIWNNNWRFRVGFFPSREEAKVYLNDSFFKSLKGMIHRPEDMKGYYTKSME